MKYIFVFAVMFAVVACTLAAVKTGDDAKACYDGNCPFDPCATNQQAHWCVMCDWSKVNRCLGYSVPGFGK